MLKKLKKHLNKRWERISYRMIENFYLVLGIATVISFIAGIWNTTEWHNWKIVSIIFVVLWIIMSCLYFVFNDKIEEKRKLENKKR